jgi:hypothetical protein
MHGLSATDGGKASGRKIILMIREKKTSVLI